MSGVWQFLNIGLWIDCSYRMNIHSDPVVQLHNPVVICPVCGEHGHTRRSCRYSNADNLVSLSQEDIAFWEFVHPRDRPECLGGVRGEPMDEDNSTDEYNNESEDGEDSGEYDSEGGEEGEEYDASDLSDEYSSD